MASIYVNVSVCICYINHVIPMQALTLTMWKMGKSSILKSSSSSAYLGLTWSFAFNLIHFRYMYVYICAAYNEALIQPNQWIFSLWVFALEPFKWCYAVGMLAWIWHQFYVDIGQCIKQTEGATTRYLMAIKNSLCSFSRSTNTCTREQRLYFFEIAAAISWKYAKCF